MERTEKQSSDLENRAKDNLRLKTNAYRIVGGVILAATVAYTALREYVEHTISQNGILNF